ncbi:hypothetical protein G6F40_017242 [Rhizopus arrhizus]|nr:hypothetical protein G6F40_017242 [Rhizopus arrhizus]
MFAAAADGLAWLASCPIIDTPVSRISTIAASTAFKKGPSTDAISFRRAGGSNCAAAGRRKQCANSMPPTHRITAITWMNFKTL